ncbi:TetR/AcrR family transcriptional regulator [Pseudoxanthomonas beigongshangi]|uniref:TetR/AcrR family transcriptional regulator n=1 Tax=Pseudoxanthomonas beigongshangi TaxID=2782537 RepID=UPI00193AE3C7|nr:TetR/AcrR family transcriptional regulator [Pseudoxanthomonas beigongshangi]MCL6713333.1 TetR family transcriptional regulator [Pseudomonas sp. R2.Fl]
MTQADPHADPRWQRTHQDLLAAFLSLVIGRRYHDIRIADVLARSGVSRSTFYEHFRNKDELLSASLEEPFRILAGLITDDTDAARVRMMLDHFWTNRALAPSLFQGPALRVVRSALVTQVEAALDRGEFRLRIPARLAAHSLADGMFSPITAWLLGESTCDAQDMAIALQRTTAATVRALQTDPLPSGDTE